MSLRRPAASRSVHAAQWLAPPVLVLAACGSEPTELTPRFSAAGVLVDEQLLLTGGAEDLSGDGPSDATWLFDLTTDTWSFAGRLPNARLRHTLDDVGGGEWLLVGGSTTGFDDVGEVYVGQPLSHGDGWAWTDTGLTELPARYKAAAIARPDQPGTLWVVGGKDNDGEQDVVHGDVWTLSRGDDGTWSAAEVPTTGGPAGLYRQEMVWDPDRELVWVFGGFAVFEPGDGEVRTDALWTLDLETGTWNRISWEGEGPSRRASHSLVWRDGGFWLWSGSHFEDARDVDLYRFTPSEDGATGRWSVTPSTGDVPPAMDAHVTVDLGDGRLLIATGDNLADGGPQGWTTGVWEVDTATGVWRQRGDRVDSPTAP